MSREKKQLWLWQGELLKILASISWYPTSVIDADELHCWIKLKDFPLDMVDQSILDAANELRDGLTSKLADCLVV